MFVFNVLLVKCSPPKTSLFMAHLAVLDPEKNSLNGLFSYTKCHVNPKKSLKFSHWLSEYSCWWVASTHVGFQKKKNQAFPQRHVLVWILLSPPLKSRSVTASSNDAR